MIGYPGSGKSSALLHAIGPIEGHTAFSDPVAHVRFNHSEVVYLGKLRKEFPGTDAMPFGHEPALKYLGTLPEESVVVGEGQRFASLKFFTKAIEMNYNVTIVRIHVPLETAKQRASARGSDFKELFWTRTTSLVDNIVKKMHVIDIDGLESIEYVGDSLKGIIYNNGDAKIHDT